MSRRWPRPAWALALVLWVTAAAAAHPGRVDGAPPWMRTLSQSGDERMAFECVAGSSNPASAVAAAEAAYADAPLQAAGPAVSAAAAAAETALQAAGIEVTGSFGGLVSFLATEEQASRPEVSRACLYTVRSRATIAPRTGPGGARPQPAAAAVAGTTQQPGGAPQTDQAAKAMLLDQWLRSNPGVNGSGVRIGIISDSFRARRALDGDNITSPCSAVNKAEVLKDHISKSSVDEGRAMAELICFTAPGAQLVFHTGFGGQAALATAILKLVDAGVKLIVDDLAYFAEPEFSPGVIAQAVTEARSRGVAYFVAAGNRGQQDAWEGAAAWVRINRTDGRFGVEARGRTFHDFAARPLAAGLEQQLPASPQLLLEVYADGDVDLYLQWDEPFISHTGGVAWPSSDLALWWCPGPRFDFRCMVSGGPGSDNNGKPGAAKGGDALEVAQLVLRGRPWYVAVELVDGRRRDHRLKLAPWSATGASMLIAPNQTRGALAATLVPHCNTPDAMAIGAAPYTATPGFNQTPALLADLSSHGGTPLLLDAKGRRLPAPQRAIKPDVVAPHDLDTSFFPSFRRADGTAAARPPPGFDPDGTGFPNFAGTSAAAPVAAAVAALMLQANPSLRPEEIYQRMRDTAQDMGAQGPDLKSGFGFLAGLALAKQDICLDKPLGHPCDDGSPCTMADACDGLGACKGLPKLCAETPCLGEGACEPATGECGRLPKPAGTPCKDYNKCTLRARCNGEGVCLPVKRSSSHNCRQP